ncbi:MAG: SDR family oxidoreductase [Candidatus Hodarchaeales archaeon]|jgi:NAD(P)-dependent dehydrogenase (short-subunit alcohol dehydrogenase family)
MVRILITGANRGLGFEFTKQYLALGNEVIATYRENNDISELLKLKNSFQNNLTLIPLDVSVSESRESAYNAVKEKFDSLDILINNAGMVTKRHLTVGKLHEDDIHISSMMGSISNRQNTSNFSYCASKAALNMFSKLLSNSLLEENIIVIPMHPGWVKTRMGTEEAPIEPEKSISGMIKVIESLTMTDSGKFLEWTGNEIMW